MKGLQHALVIDNADISVNYKHTDINSKYLHKVSLEELFQIFNEDNNEIFKYDTSDCITFILSDNTEIPISDYNGKMNTRYIKISNKELKEADSELIIKLEKEHVNVSGHYYSYDNNYPDKSPYIKTKRWDDIENINIAESDLNGFEYTYGVYNNCINNSKSLPYALNIAVNKRYSQHSIDYIGYIPSIGQMIILFKYLKMINYILGKSWILCSNLLKLNRGVWWTSSIFYLPYIWVFLDGEIKTMMQNVEGHVLTMYKQKIKG